ncbi:MAG: hypothetical protein Q9195_007962 [Heterodermia aff. obscurata]
MVGVMLDAGNITQRVVDPRPFSRRQKTRHALSESFPPNFFSVLSLPDHARAERTSTTHILTLLPEVLAMPGHPGNPNVGPCALPAGCDPEVNTRREYTDRLTAVTPRDFAKPAWADLCNTLRDLTRALAYHEVMEPNIDDPYMKPANRKTKVYHMWDFVGRTLSMVLANDPDLPRRQRGLWKEVMGRAQYGKLLMMDTTGMLDAMCPDDNGEKVEFGGDVLAIVQRIA